MPHRHGHTAIEMSPKPRRHHNRSPVHESPNVHATPLHNEPHGRTLSPSADRSHHGSRGDVSHGSHNNHSSSGNNLNVHSGHHSNTHSAPSLHSPSGSHSNSLNNVNHGDNHSRHRRDVTLNVEGTTDKAPLLETDTANQKPPLAGPEIDDLDDDNTTPAVADGQPGVDDGFYNSGDETATDEKRETDDEDPNGVGIASRFDPATPFPLSPEFMPGAQPRVIPDVNVYQQKKNLAQGMMDLALLSANANQLRYVLEAGGDYHPYFYPSMIFISASLILQIAVGVGLIVNSTYDVKDRDDICKADKINNFTVIGIFLITVVNVFIASFGVTQYPTSTAVSAPAV